MIPITFFTDLSKACADRPFALLPESEQKQYFSKLKKIVADLKKKLEDRELTKTHGYRIASQMWETVKGDEFHEARFADALAQMDEMYGPDTTPDLLKQVKHLDTFAEKFKKRSDEFYFLEERVKQEASQMTTEAIETHDQKILLEIGSFYIWEYTLTLAQEMEKADDEKKQKLLENGLQTNPGNLPGLKPLIKSMRQELAFHIYNTKRRWQIQRIFFDFGDVLKKSDSLTEVIKGLKKFHIYLLTVALQAGITTFRGLIYKPYPDGTPLQNIIKDLKKSTA